MNPALNIAVSAARKAGRIINIASNDLDRIVVEKKGASDFVSRVDRDAEATIIEMISKAFPDHSILGEESGSIHPSGKKTKADYEWMIDPLDGTTNFLHGLPHYSVSIALYHKGKGEVAVIFDPNRNELYTALKGKGAMVDNRRLRVSSRHQLSEVLMGTGFPFPKDNRVDSLPIYLRQMEDLMRHTAGLRRAGSAALDLAYVAAGRLDGFWEMGLSPWDIAAGVLLVREAGGIVTETQGGPDFMRSGNVLAAGGVLHEKILQRFVALEA